MDVVSVVLLLLAVFFIFGFIREIYGIIKELRGKEEVELLTKIPEGAEIKGYKFPIILWFLPVFFGLIGGIVAALIASLKYRAKTPRLLILGILRDAIFVILLRVFFTTFSSIFRSVR